MADDQGASPRELLLEAARRNNTDLLDELLGSMRSEAGDEAQGEYIIAELINTARDGMGYTALHLVAKYGSYDAADILLDQVDVETDPIVPSTSATPLHLAVEYSNEQGKDEWPASQALVEMFVDAGCDPRMRDKSKRKPVELVDARNDDLKNLLRRAEAIIVESADIINEDEMDKGGDGPPTDDEL